MEMSTWISQSEVSVKHPNTPSLLMGNFEAIYSSLGSAAACVGKKACGKPVEAPDGAVQV